MSNIKHHLAAGYPTVEELQKRLTEAEVESAERLAGWQRSRADYQNLKRETEERLRGIATEVKLGFLREILPVYGHLRQATVDPPDPEHIDAWIRGIKQIREEFDRVLKKWNVTAITTVGEAFDPQVHEAVQATSEEPTHVVQELEAGYRVGDRLVYPAKVMVGSNTTANEE